MTFVENHIFHFRKDCNIIFFCWNLFLKRLPQKWKKSWVLIRSESLSGTSFQLLQLYMFSYSLCVPCWQEIRLHLFWFLVFLEQSLQIPLRSTEVIRQKVFSQTIFKCLENSIGIETHKSFGVSFKHAWKHWK